MDEILLNSATSHLRKKDKVMSGIIRQCGIIIPEKTRRPHYHALVSAIVNQQLSYKAGQTIEKRLLKISGGRHFSAERILALEEVEMRQCGLSANKVRYIYTLARAIADGELNFRKLSQQSDDRVRDELIQYPGIGQWSVDMFLMFSLRRADIFPVGDLVIRRSMQKFYQLPDTVKHDEYRAIADAWRPYRTIASLYLWKTSD